MQREETQPVQHRATPRSDQCLWNNSSEQNILVEKQLHVPRQFVLNLLAIRHAGCRMVGWQPAETGVRKGAPSGGKTARFVPIKPLDEQMGLGNPIGTGVRQ